MFIVEAYITRAARPKYLEGQCSQELILAIFTAGFPFFFQFMSTVKAHLMAHNMVARAARGRGFIFLS